MSGMKLGGENWEYVGKRAGLCKSRGDVYFR
jgi:hypothetical protein